MERLSPRQPMTVNVLARVALLWTLTAFAACADDDGIVLIIHGNLTRDLGLTAVQVVVHEEDGGVHDMAWYDASPADSPASELLPTPFKVLVERHDLEKSWISVRGYGSSGPDAAPLITYQARAGIPRSALHVLEVPLAKACATKSCPTNETCYPRSTDTVVAGACGPIPEYPLLDPYRRDLSPSAYASMFQDLPDGAQADGGLPRNPSADRRCDEGSCIVVADQRRPFAMNQLAGTYIELAERRKVVALGIFLELRELSRTQTVAARATRIRLALYHQLKSGVPFELLGETREVDTRSVIDDGRSPPRNATQADLKIPVAAGPGGLWIFFLAPGELSVRGTGAQKAWMIGAPGAYPFEQNFPDYPLDHTRPADQFYPSFSPFSAAVYAVTERLQPGE